MVFVYKTVRNRELFDTASKECISRVDLKPHQCERRLIHFQLKTPKKQEPGFEWHTTRMTWFTVWRPMNTIPLIVQSIFRPVSSSFMHRFFLGKFDFSWIEVILDFFLFALCYFMWVHFFLAEAGAGATTTVACRGFDLRDLNRDDWWEKRDCSRGLTRVSHATTSWTRPPAIYWEQLNHDKWKFKYERKRMINITPEKSHQYAQ